jgi:hypothetical protein
MVESNDSEAKWLSVVGRSLAYLCLSKAMESEPGKFDTVLKKVAFLEGLGLSRDDAALAAGSSAGSVRELQRLRRKKKTIGKKHARKK